MAQSAADSTQKTFGIFINSNQSLMKSSAKSAVQIPFNGNLADHDPNKELQCALTSMHFTNTLYNVTTENNRLRLLVYWAAGRGFDAKYEELEITIPVGFYTLSSLADYLSLPDIIGFEKIQQRFVYDGGESFNNIFGGFGAVPADPSDTVITKAATLNTSGTKLVFQSPDIAHLIQYGTDIVTPVLNPAQFNNTSYVYEGIYFYCDGPNDEIYSPLLKQLGFITPTTPPLEIPLSLQYGKAQYGYGIRYEAKVVAGVDAHSSNTYYIPIGPGLDDQAAANAILAPINFHGVIVEANSVALTMAYMLNNGGEVVELDNGMYVNGTNLTVPAPYVVGFNDCKFTGTVTNAGLNSNNITNISVQAGTLQVGMCIGIRYNPETKIPLDPVKAQYFNYNTGTLVPGFENTHAYYIAEIINETTVRLNQNYVASAGFTSNQFLATSYVLTTPQEASATGLYENMIASPVSVTEATAQLIPSNVSNMSGVDELHVHCTELRTDNLSSNNYGALAPSDVIAVIPVEAEFGHAQSYLPPNPLTSYLNNTNISVMNLEITDPRGFPVDFNGVDWSMTLFCTETTVPNASQLQSQGSLNTPFQDQLAAMEGTALAQDRKRRITFYDSKKNAYGGYSNRY